VCTPPAISEMPENQWGMGIDSSDSVRI
jgi:hypothetical protein